MFCRSTLKILGSWTPVKWWGNRYWGNWLGWEKQKKSCQDSLSFFTSSNIIEVSCMSSKTTYVRWHQDNLIGNDELRHPKDTPSWRTFDIQHASSSSLPRNVRSGLASDGFIPYRSVSIKVHGLSYWFHIIFLNGCIWSKLTLWCLYSFLGLLSPGNDIYVYLCHLLEELKELWIDREDIYDH